MMDDLLLLKLSVQSALIGEITRNMVGIACGLHDGKIRVIAYLDAPVTLEDTERLQILTTEVIADFPEGYTIEEECVFAPRAEYRSLDFWAFLRAEE